ncbi:MAG: HD domain-containing protein, partial [Chitinivibrionales bacterium]
AVKSSETAGRAMPIDPDPFRLDFARDGTKILHSPPFRRLKHKTQVFLAPDNDHICTRMEHVLHVSSIASVIGQCLRLNNDLINAIALGHDLGHPPFGHIGEKTLNEILINRGYKEGFKHEIHGLRVVDKLTNYGNGLNLTYEVRDGIVCHCGEKFERILKPDRERDIQEINSIKERSFYPSTLEGCLVRLVDRIAYLGRDLEDGIKAGLITKGKIPESIRSTLGETNSSIIDTFVKDTIAASADKDKIAMSPKIFDEMNNLKTFNYENIYINPAVERKAVKGGHVISQLFRKCIEILEESERGRNTGYVKDILNEADTMHILFDFIKNSNYTEETPLEFIVRDYIAGMTDPFAQRSYLQLLLPAPIV